MIKAWGNENSFYKQNLDAYHALNKVDEAKQGLLAFVFDQLESLENNVSCNIANLAANTLLNENVLAANLIGKAQEQLNAIDTHCAQQHDPKLNEYRETIVALENELKLAEYEKSVDFHSFARDIDALCFEELKKKFAHLLDYPCQQKGRGNGVLKYVEVCRNSSTNKVEFKLKIDFEEEGVKTIDISYWLDKSSITIFQKQEAGTSAHAKVELDKAEFSYICSDAYYRELYDTNYMKTVADFDKKTEKLTVKLAETERRLKEQKQKLNDLLTAIKVSAEEINKFFCAVRRGKNSFSEAGLVNYYKSQNQLEDIPLQLDSYDSESRKKAIVFQLCFNLIGVMLFGESYSKDWHTRETANYIVNKLCQDGSSRAITEAEQEKFNKLMFHEPLARFVGDKLTKMPLVNSHNVQEINKTFNAWYFRDPYDLCDPKCSISCSKKNCHNFTQGLEILSQASQDIYTEPAYSEYYYKVYLPKYINQVVEYLLNDDIQQRLDNMDEIRVLSLGCGPANDLFALEYLQKLPDNALCGKNVKYVGVDSGASWADEQKVLTSCQSPNLDIKFISKDIRDFVRNPEELGDFQPNLILMNFVLSDMQKFNALDILKDFPKDYARHDELIEAHKAQRVSEMEHNAISLWLKDDLWSKDKEKLNYKMLYASYRLDHKIEKFVQNLVQFVDQYGSDEALVIISDYYDGAATWNNYGTGNIPFDYLRSFGGLNLHNVIICDEDNDEMVKQRKEETEDIIGDISSYRGDIINDNLTENRQRRLYLFKLAFCYHQKNKA